MSGYIQAETELAAQSFFLGLLLMASYDGLRLFRFLVPHGNLWIGLEDLLYWLYAAAMTFSLLFRENSGILRGYVIVSVFVGMFLYDRLVSKSVFGVLKNLREWTRIRIKKWKSGRKERKNEREPQ